MTFLATASGLMIDRVRSSAIVALRAGPLAQETARLTWENPRVDAGLADKATVILSDCMATAAPPVCTRVRSGLRSNKRLIEQVTGGRPAVLDEGADPGRG